MSRMSSNCVRRRSAFLTRGVALACRWTRRAVPGLALAWAVGLGGVPVTRDAALWRDTDGHVASGGICWFANTSIAAAQEIASPADLSGMVLQYKGAMTPTRGDDQGRKPFELTVVVANASAEGAMLYWTLAEQGPGGWSWPDRFGRVELDAAWRASGSGGPVLLYDRGDGKSQVPVVLPVVTTGVPGQFALAKDAAWESGKLEHRVVGAEKRGDRQTWRVEARNSYGVKRTLWVDAASPLVAQVRERVFIGQGQEHELRVELASIRKLDATEQAAAKDGFERLVALREQLAQEPLDEDVHWNDKQLAMLKAEQPAIEKLADAPLIGALAKAIAQDAKSQRGRAGAIASLREKAIGNVLPADFRLEGIGGAVFQRDQAKGKVTILHFWEYRDVPLEEPYGQAGFLDFLNRQRRKSGVEVYGVVVHESAETDTSAKRRSAQAAGRFKAFMNLSYPLLQDDGTVLRTLGDPRVTGEKLPLWVVIGPAGDVIEYHAGFYEVHRDRGLEALDAIVTKAAKKPE